MNIAFPALFVFALALPGIILRSSYRGWTWEIPVYPLPLAEEMARSLFSAAVLHAGWCWLSDAFGYRINFGDVLILLTGGFGLPSTELANRLPAITRHPCAIAIYFSSIYLVAAVIGVLGHILVRNFSLDLKWKIFRFDNFWYYVISGEYYYFREAHAGVGHKLARPGKRRKPLIFVSCVVSHGSGSFIYYGFPTEHYYDRLGNLERILMQNVTYAELITPREEARRTRAAEKAKTAGMRDSPHLFTDRLPIVGQFLMLNAPDIHNLSVHYFFLDPVGKAPPKSVPKEEPPAEPATNTTQSKVEQSGVTPRA